MTAGEKIIYEGEHTNEILAQMIDDALVAEREACAETCDRISKAFWDEYKHGNGPGRADSYVQGQSDGSESCAAAIRARGQREA